MKKLFQVPLFAILMSVTMASCTSCNQDPKNTSEEPAPVDTNIVDSTQIDKTAVDSAKKPIDSAAKNSN